MLVHYDFINSLYKWEKPKQLKTSPFSTKTKKAEIIVKQVRKIVVENKQSSLNKIEKETTKTCSHCHNVVCFAPKLQQIMAFNQLENSK